MGKFERLQTRGKYWEEETHILDNYPGKKPCGGFLYPSDFEKRCYLRGCTQFDRYNKKIEKYLKRHFIFNKKEKVKLGKKLKKY